MSASVGFRQTTGWLVRTVCLLALLSVGTFGGSTAQASNTEVFGGPGGVPFQTSCPAGDYLVGLSVDSGDWIDAIAPVCARFDGAALVVVDIGKFAGMMGGQLMPNYRCKFGTELITSMVVQATFDDNSRAKYADNLDLSCANVNTPTVVAYHFQVLTNDNALGGGKCDVGWQCLNDISVPYPVRPLSCSPGEVATGIQGRAGNYVDALGLLCGPLPAKAIALPAAPVAARSGADRPGNDYHSYPTSQPADCQAKCQGDPTCKAWSWAIAGTNGVGPATCYMKRPAPVEAANNCCISGLSTALPPAPKGAKAGSDRPGSDYFSFISNDPANCALSCSKDAKCKAWTWAVAATHSNPRPICYLKNAVPNEVANGCCVSGIAYISHITASGMVSAITGSATAAGGAIPPGAVAGLDRPGGDFSATPAASPASCAQSCAANATCKAWTWAVAGTNGAPRPMCYLKNIVPPTKNDSCCVSGVVASSGGPGGVPGSVVVGVPRGSFLKRLRP